MRGATMKILGDIL